MIKIHKLKDGDIIKILPIISDDDKVTWSNPYSCTVIDGKAIYDNSDKQYLRRISYLMSRGFASYSKKLNVSNRYAMNIYIDGEIRVMNIGRTIYQLLIDKKEALDIKSDYHLYINMEMKSGFPCFDKSYVKEHSWIPPVSNINSGEEWIEYIRSNQPDFSGHVENNNIFKHKKIITDYIGTDMLGELISDDRQKKLDMIGI